MSQRRAHHSRQGLHITAGSRQDVGNLQVREVEHSVVHVVVHQILDVPHEALGIHNRGRRLGRSLDQQTSGFVSVAVGQRDEDVDEIPLLRLLQLVHQAGIEKNELRMRLSEAEGAMADRLR